MRSCLKCGKRRYCSRFCKEHFVEYFERKFKKHLSKNNLLDRGEVLNLTGENKRVLKFLLNELGYKVNVEFSKKGRSVSSYSLTTKCVELLNDFMKEEGLRPEYGVSFLECFTDEEIKSFADLKGLSVEEPGLNNFEARVKSLMNELESRRPNIYYCTYKMMNSFRKY